MRSGFNEENEESVEHSGACPGAGFKCESEGGAPAKKGRIDPAVKAWLDNVLVPAMVRLYLAKAATDSG